MLQLRKCFCGISTIFFQCCFMSETQVLMIFSDFFFCFFSRSHFLEGGFIFQWGASFLGASALMGGVQKKSSDGVSSPCPPPTMGNPTSENIFCTCLKRLMETNTLTYHINKIFLAYGLR